MTMEEKRKHARIDSLHLINYLLYEKTEKDASQGMGRTLNVSESGILLETHAPIETHLKILLTIGIEEDVVDIEGKIVYSKQNDKGMYESGIELFVKDDATKEILKVYIKAFNEHSNDDE